MSENGQMIVQFRGVRGSIPAPSPENMRYGGNTSCVEIRFAGQLFILDAGSGIRLLGDELLQNAQGKPIEAALLLSHSHWDHIQGLPFFAPGYSPENRLTIFGASGRGEQLQRALAGQMAPLHFPVGLEQMRGVEPVRELSSDATKFGNVLIRTTHLNHPGGCTGFRFECAAGHVAYLPDHEPYRNNGNQAGDSAQRALIEFVRGVDLLILDTQYTAEEYARRIGWGHGCLPDSVQLAIESGARRLILFHHDPAHDDRQIEQMIATARTLTGDSALIIDAASEHELISLSPSNIGLTPAPGFSAHHGTVIPTIPSAASQYVPR
ncbi:MAG TPA: MBL fold metallo-hydrolase [Chthoniobacterales bacterium]|nr:MBL fold metallo-hydrolase [Chthoniobacterales bacterium]